MKIVKYKRYKCYLEEGTYPNGRMALELVSVRNGEPVLVATTNIPDVFINEDEVIIKNYGENEGILEVLIQDGIISNPIKTIENGYVSMPVCKYLINTLEHA